MAKTKKTVYVPKCCGKDWVIEKQGKSSGYLKADGKTTPFLDDGVMRMDKKTAAALARVLNDDPVACVIKVVTEVCNLPVSYGALAAKIGI